MSRSLGFIAGLTLPAGIYYYSSLNLEHKTKYIQAQLHEQANTLRNPTKPEVITYVPKNNEDVPGRIRQGWNQGIENGVRYIQETDWENAARTTAKVATNLAHSAYQKLQPTIEDTKEKLGELSEKTKDGAQHAGESIGSAIHTASEKAQDAAHQASIKSQELAKHARIESEELAEQARIKSAELAEQARLKSAALKEQTIKQAREAGDVLETAQKKAAEELSRLGSRTAEVAHDVQQESAEKLETLKEEASDRWSWFRTKVAEKTADVKQEASQTAEEAKISLDHAQKKADDGWSFFKTKTAEKTDVVKEDAVSGLQKADFAIKSAIASMTSKVQDLQHAVGNTVSDAKEAVEIDNLASKLRKSEDWILAQQRFRELEDSIAQAASMKKKEMQEAIHSRRIGFSSVNDPSQAAKHVKAAELANKKPLL